MRTPSRGTLMLLTDQLLLELDRPLTNGDDLLTRLRTLGMNGIDRCVLTSNRSVMISFRQRVLRVHHAYLGAPPGIHQAIVAFVTGRTRPSRRMAQRLILAYPIPAEELRAPRPRVRRVRPSDVPLIAELARCHGHYNLHLFGGELQRIAIHVSGRMRNRLGQYTVACAPGRAAEITISRRHIRRHGWEEARHTLLHEMVHQWQAENGLPIDHGREFRRKAREIAIVPRARRSPTTEGRGKRKAGTA